jgi:ribosomal protein S18 acetylase RimI-like enzyme
MDASSPPPSRPGETSIRHARVEDAVLTARIRVDGWRAAYRGQLPDDLLGGLSVERDTVRFADHLGHLASDRRVWVSEVGGEVMGFASTGASRDEDTPDAAEVYALYVRPEAQGRGIGGGLLEHAVRDLSERGYTEAVLWALVTNGAAQRFYERRGWRRDGTTKIDRLDEFELNEMRYRLDLTGASPPAPR